MSVIALAGAAVLAGACGGSVTERDQWTVWVATDASVPQIVDRAFVEVLDESGGLACPECRRELGLPLDGSAWPISFGIVASDPAKAWRVRVRLYRAARAGADGLPPRATAIDRVARLPPAHGNTDVAMVLDGECIGVAASLEQRTSCARATRTLAPEEELPLGRPDPAFAPGTWARSRAPSCAGPIPDGMVCVHGGLFSLGESRVREDASVLFAPVPERFVTLAPFAFDRDEVTVGAVRALVRAGRLTDVPIVRTPTPTDPRAYCTYLGPDDASNDDQPVACISHAVATSICAALGKRLPTEAEWEWVAGNLEEETLFPWGNGGSPCEYADVGLGFHIFEQTGTTSDLCRVKSGQPTATAGLPRKANPRDVTALGVRALGGGLAEWVADDLGAYSGPCWQPTEPFLTNPRCVGGDIKVVRGQAWTDPPVFVAVARRRGAPSAQISASIGVRCAASQEPK